MDCTSESASHYAGCECNEEHWREQLAAAVAAREEAERGIAAVIAQRDQHETDEKTACERLRTLRRMFYNVCADKAAAEARAERLEGVDAAARELFRALDYVTPGWRADTCVVHGDEVNRAWFELEKKLGQGPDAALAEEVRR